MYLAAPVLDIPCSAQSTEQRQAGIRELPSEGMEGTYQPVSGHQTLPRPRWSYRRDTRPRAVWRPVFEHHFPGLKPFSREKQTVTRWEP